MWVTRLDNVADSGYVMDTTRTKEIEMTTKTRTAQTALDAYMEHRTAALALLARIHEAIETHDNSATTPEDIHWGHVGEMAENERVLREMADRIFGEGEHAED